MKNLTKAVAIAVVVAFAWAGYAHAVTGTIQNGNSSKSERNGGYESYNGMWGQVAAVVNHVVNQSSNNNPRVTFREATAGLGNLFKEGAIESIHDEGDSIKFTITKGKSSATVTIEYKDFSSGDFFSYSYYTVTIKRKNGYKLKFNVRDEMDLYYFKSHITTSNYHISKGNQGLGINDSNALTPLAKQILNISEGL